MTDYILVNTVAQQQKELKHMRVLASGLLFLMLILFIITSIMESAHPWLAYLRAFAEASMVGACADWFAVVALFRHPFGVPIPHTAIIPKHRKRIGENLGHFISNNFLAPTVVTARMKSVDAAGWITHWLKEPGNAKLLAEHLQGLFPPLFDLLSEEQIHSFSRSLIRNGIDSIAAAPLAGRLLSVLVAHGYHDKLFELAIDKAQEFFDNHKENILQKVAKNSYSWLPSWVDSKLTDAFLDELLDTLAATSATNHPWHIEYQKFLNQLTIRLANDPDLFEQCEQIKTEVLDNAVVDSYLDWLGKEIEAKVQTELSNKDGILSGGLERALLSLGNWLDNDKDTRAKINQWAQQLVLNTVVPNRAEISTFVADVVARWDTATLVDKLELQVGKDLQYIRINGTIVGGLVGLLIFTVVRMFS
jgi:uncharacterized membrane-anchored protein YjiN (DUF445 family)